MMAILLLLSFILIQCVQCQVRNSVDEYCITEVFRPQCMSTDVILMKSATYGRMRVGRCLTAEEVAAHRSRFGDDPSYFGCSVNVLDLLDQRCSGRRNCDVRVAEILEQNIRPCFTGLMVYLEASYDCITVVDEKRSCIIKAMTDPIHILSPSKNQGICGTESQPWIVESPVGQKISATIIDFKKTDTVDRNKQLCNSYGTIVDKTVTRNVSICGRSGQRLKKLYTSAGNTLEIYFNAVHSETGDQDERQFALSLVAVGCSDVIPGEETWLKRKDDAIVIGCYSSRQTWQLSCIEGKWIGVLGNCSAKNNQDLKETFDNSISSIISDQEQVLAIIAISGCTFAVCLVIVCVGILCLRRFYFRYKNQQDYKSLSLQRNPDAAQHLTRGTLSVAEAEAVDQRVFNPKLLPTYSVYVGDNDLCDTRDKTNIFNYSNNQ